MNTPLIQENGTATRTPLVKGNEAFRQGNYAHAIGHYAQAIIQQPGMVKSISANLVLARQRYRTGRQAIPKPVVAVCGWELAHNPAGRVYTLATIYESFAQVEIIGSIFPSFDREIWEPIRDTAIAKHTFIVEDESKFIEQAIQLVSTHPYDIVHLSKPRAPNIFFGILYKLLWGAKVLMDIDDEELAFVGAETPINIEDYIQQHSKLPDLKKLAGLDWTRLAVGLAKEFDGVTVCNAALQERYGGEIIRHARDERLFKPSPELKWKSREKYGIPQDAKVVLFFGTPRKHKGLLETAQAIASLNRTGVIFCIVGSFSDESLKQRLLEIDGCNYKFLPNQPISKIPEVLAIADCCVLLQSSNSAVVKWQTPAKISDALAMGIRVLTNYAEDIDDSFKDGLIIKVNPENLLPILEIALSNNNAFNYESATLFKNLLSVKKCSEKLIQFTNSRTAVLKQNKCKILLSNLNANNVFYNDLVVLYGTKNGKTNYLAEQENIGKKTTDIVVPAFNLPEGSAQGTDNLKRKDTRGKHVPKVEPLKKTDPLATIRQIAQTPLGGMKTTDPDKIIKNIQTSTAKHHTQEAVKQAYKAFIEGINGDSIRAWCVNTRKPDEVFEIEVFLDGHYFITVKNIESRLDLKKAGLSGGLGGISFASYVAHLDDGEHFFSLRLPDGTFSNTLEVEGKRSVYHRPTVSDCIPHRPVTIIVPIFNAPGDLEICIKRILAHTPPYAKILLIDDCSTDPRIGDILLKYESKSTIRILRNLENCGFTRTVNRGIDEAGEDDVILLNSDARVTPRWLEGMLVAASSAPRIATVTAMSDRAGAFSAPQMGNDNKLPEGVDEITYARTFRRRSLGLYPQVPTGNGFCMYVRRQCISSIGSLDAQAFPRGYGEENDFCMRALRAGWRHVIDDRTYVFHDRSKSFGQAKTQLMKAGRDVVDERYPEYKKAIRVFSTSEKIALARNRARLAVQDCADAGGEGWIPRVLFAIATQTGGTPQTNRDLMETLAGTFECWVLRCDSKMLELSRMSDGGKIRVVRSRKLQEPVDPLTHNSDDYDAVVSGWLQDFDFDLVHIRHLGWHGLSLPHLARQLGIKVVYSFHDFYALSSTFKLIDDAGAFLGNTFLEEGSVYRESLWPKDALPTPHGNWLAFWRERFQAALEYCDAFVTTADSARQLILDAMPRLPADRFVVIPHGRDFPEFHRIRQKPKLGKPVRILVPGHINAVKGLEIIRALVEHDKAGKLEFHILGRLIGEKPKKGIVNLGSYERHEFAKKARAVHPHLGIIFSVWDETYCHTLTELWSVGLPAAVLDFPNVADRVRRSGAGWVLDHHDIAKLYEEIVHLAFDEWEYERTEQALADWQGGYGLANSTAQMAAGYLNIYSDVLREGGGKRQALSPYSRKRIGVVCPASANLHHAPGSTYIRIWERTCNVVERDVTYIKMTPTMLLASAREKMLDGVIIQRMATSIGMMDEALAALAKSKIPYLLGLDDDVLKKTQSSFDEAVRMELNKGTFIEKVNSNADVLVVDNKYYRPRIAVCVHVFYAHRWELISSYLRNIRLDFDLFVTCPAALVPVLKNVNTCHQGVTIISMDNIGMDVLPFLKVVQEHKLWRYDVILKLHTKNDKTEQGDVLGRLLLDGVLGTPELVDRVLEELLYSNATGMVGAECMYRSALKIMNPNRPNVEKILSAMSVSWPNEEWGFFAGTMFWVHGALLNTLNSNYSAVVNQAYVEEQLASTGGDGKWAHAMERVFGLLPVLGGRGVSVSYPSTAKGEHTHLRKVPSVELNLNRSYSRPSHYYVLRYKHLAAWAELCRKSNLFDEAYYRAHAGSRLPAEMDAATHFVLFGDGLDLNPSSQFSAVDYLRNNLDVLNAKPSIPSLVHFLRHGVKEGRTVFGAA